MIALPRIRLWDEFWRYRLQPDKEAFAEMIGEWPASLVARLKEVIRARFGDERFTGPSIMEALQNLGFWPLDAVTQRVLIELGNADVNSEAELRRQLDKLRRYSFYLLARGVALDFECLSSLSAADGAAMIRGIAIAEEFGYSEAGGSVSMVNWSFAVFRQHHALPVWAELADWIVVETTNPYIPFNFQRTRHQWASCREGSSSPAETWRRVGEAEARHQRERTERMERASRESRERSILRQTRLQKNREEHEARRQTNSLERQSICSELEQLSPLQRLERICADASYPLDFYPTEFAAVDDATIAAMSDNLRAALLERLKGRRAGEWRNLLRRLAPSSPDASER